MQIFPIDLRFLAVNTHPTDNQSVSSVASNTSSVASNPPRGGNPSNPNNKVSCFLVSFFDLVTSALGSFDVYHLPRWWQLRHGRTLTEMLLLAGDYWRRAFLLSPLSLSLSLFLREQNLTLVPTTCSLMTIKIVTALAMKLEGKRLVPLVAENKMEQ
jgi:hypothetical protein